jgi:hypothetical protein
LRADDPIDERLHQMPGSHIGKDQGQIKTATVSSGGLMTSKVGVF